MAKRQLATEQVDPIYKQYNSTEPMFSSILSPEEYLDDAKRKGFQELVSQLQEDTIQTNKSEKPTEKKISRAQRLYHFFTSIIKRIFR